MIPRRIRLHNFLSYRECTVDFQGLHLAVLSGPNGHGKSALLDAMTWALWGRARGKGDAERIRADGGASEMLVDFEFENHGHVYRVVRKFSRARGGSLDFQQVLADGMTVPLGGIGVRETQAAINRRLRLDYETFINSAFIAQGRSNEFTAKTPTERKQVLRNILGLDMFEVLAQRANDLRKAAGFQLQQLESEVEQLTEALNELDSVRRRISEVAEHREALSAEVKSIQEEVAELQAVVAQRKQLVAQVEELDARRSRLYRELQSVRQHEQATREKLHTDEQRLTGADAVAARYEELQKLRERDRRLDELQRHHLELTNRLQELETTLLLARRELERTLKEREQDLADASAYVSRLTEAAAGLDELDRLAQERAALLAALEERREQADVLRRRASERRAEARTLAAQENELRAQEDQLRAAAGAPECPVCHQPLTPEHVSRVLAESTERRRELSERGRALVQEAERLENEASALEQAVGREKQALEEAARREHARRVALEAERQAGEEALQRIPGLEMEVANLREALTLERYGEDTRRELRRVREELARLEYDAEEHERIRQAVRELAPVEQEHLEIKLAQTRVGSLRAELQRLAEQARTLERESAETEDKLREAREALAATDDVEPVLRAAEARWASLQGQLRETDTEFGRLQEQERALGAKQARLAELRDRAASLREESELYAELQRAFGRDGVQAMLIDQAVPRIRELANRLLDRMTAGRIHVDMKTQRNLSSRQGTEETLEIRVSDELGERTYEMYSGGEAFRVDFALRIALAKLLAERAGATLATLIVDEGFGTQDRDGIDRLVEILNAIAPEFELILVVTHLDELKERFERRIEVQKDPELGSLARVL